MTGIKQGVWRIMAFAEINRERLAVVSVIGEIHAPTIRPGYIVATDGGVPRVLPRVGGISYNIKIGDGVYGMEGDHLEPGVSVKNKDAEENAALNTLSCVGNPAYVVSGDAKGERGLVTGTHGGIEHVLVYFEKAVLEKLTVGDKIQIRACGQGMKIKGFEDAVACMNTAPDLFDRLRVEVKGGKLVVPVAATVPAHLMGSGMGSASAYAGDYDIMTADAGEKARLGLDKLRYGDIVLLEDCDNVFGRGYRKGARAVGVVVHGDCILAGHGPGVTTLLASRTAVIEGKIDANANLADFWGVQ
ncbi:MAG: DUF4438 domain-containing protein [Clostridiales bacterium]|jgi:hypothetical protein|nr:DUF4438 domain-containing protein [Clostridiales bacterium]